MAAHPQPGLTPEQYLAIERAAEFRSEFYNGKMYAMAGGSYQHALVTGNVIGILHRELKKGCHALSNDMRVRVAPRGLYTYPDVVVLCEPPKFLDVHTDTLLNPTLIIEVLSPSTERYDRGFKSAQYRELESLQEYALVSQSEPRVELFRRQTDGTWVLHEAKGLKAVIRFESGDCTLKLGELYDGVTLEAEAAPPPGSNTMLRAGIFALIFSAAAMAADWTEYKDGPFRVISNAGDGDARKILTEMEQLRFELGGMLGKDAIRREELDATWPIILVLFDSDKDRAAYALPTPFVEGGSANLSTTPSPAWRGAIAMQLIEANAGRMPPNIETALVDLFSTIEVRTTRVAIGAPVKGLSGARHREWAKLHMIATRPEYAGRFRVYLKNLQGGDPELAAFNTFNLKKEELEKRMNDYADKGVFEAVEVFGEAITPSKEFYERRMPQAEVDAILAELKAAGKSFPPESARGQAKQNTRESLYAAMGLNPKWAGPHAQIAALFADPKSKVAPLMKATQLEPRNSGYWEALARAQSDAGMFIEASKSWISAERAAATDEEKTRLHGERAKIENQRVEAEMAAAREAKDEQERELRRVIAESAARVKAAQDKANRENGAQATFTTGQTVKFGELNNGTRVAGRLIAVECVDSIFKLDIQGANSAITTVLIRKNPEVEGKPVFACGPVDPARRIEVAHNNKADVRWNTVGEVETYDLK